MKPTRQQVKSHLIHWERDCFIGDDNLCQPPHNAMVADVVTLTRFTLTMAGSVSARVYASDKAHYENRDRLNKHLLKKNKEG